jgi:hypothetical protein
MSLNLGQNLLFKINTIEDNSGYLNKKINRLKKPIIVEDYNTPNNLLIDKKIENDKINNKDKNIVFNPFNPFIFNKNSIINSGEDISYKMTFDTLSNINASYQNTINIPNINYKNPLLFDQNENNINLNQNKIIINENEKQKMNLKLKKKRKFNKFKVSYMEPKTKNNYKLNHKRKYKPDDIRKKIKARFHKSIKNIINENLKKAGSKYFFSFLPQIFISSISREKNNQVLDLTYRQILSMDFVNDIDEDKYKNKKVDYSKYKNNLRVLEYLDEHPDICKNSGFDIIGNMKYKDLLEQYFNSEEFDKAIQKLKDENEEEEYIEEYQNKAKTYIQFFANLGSNKFKDDKINYRNGILK